MVMSKKEQEIFNETLLKIEITKALHWTEKIEPDVSIPQKDMTTGWLFSLSSQKVYKVWSTSSHHGNMPLTPNSVQYKNGIALFSTEVKALLALRYAIEEHAAVNLLEIDKQIRKTLR
jgi:hypothetical protein